MRVICRMLLKDKQILKNLPMNSDNVIVKTMKYWFFTAMIVSQVFINPRSGFILNKMYIFRNL